METYDAVKGMATLLSIPYSFPSVKTRQAALSFPELQLMALVVVAVKFHHPFDGIERQVTALTDAGAMTIDWDAWCQNQTIFNKRTTAGGKIGRGNEIKVKEQDALSMSGAQMDEYMDWFQRTWVEEDKQHTKPGGLPAQILDMFPTGRLDGSSPPTIDIQELAKAEQEALDSKLETATANLKVRDVVSREEEERSKVPVRRIGSFYKRYKKDQDFPPAAKLFYETAAELIGVSFFTMVIAVLQTEQKLLNHRTKQLKEEAKGNSEGEGTGRSQTGEVGDAMEYV